MKKIGIGYENYREFIDDNLYYVDKTLLIRDVLEKGGKVTLFTRPRRFGKTLALSMLRTFFEYGYDVQGNLINAGRYFEGKKIMQAGPEILSMMGRFPVICLSLKSAKQPDFRASFLKLREELTAELFRHKYLLVSDELIPEQKAVLLSLLTIKQEDEIVTEEDLKKEVTKYSTCLKTLSMALATHHHQNVVVLMDEYDVPLENAWSCGFYDDMVTFIRSLFESTLKTNDFLKFAVVTGCLRISKESIFTGLNNLEISSVRGCDFEDAFGFTQDETEEMLRYYGIEYKIPEAKEWYDGYLFGKKEIYNPWSITKYVKSIVVKKMVFPEPYWSNTSSNLIIKDLIDHAGPQTKKELDVLMNGGTIEKRIHEDITYEDIHKSDDNLWNFLFFTGYMKSVSERRVGNEIYMTMRIPNTEIKTIYETQIREWFNTQIKETDRSEFYKAVLAGDVEKWSGYVKKLLFTSISTFDSNEFFYHGFLLSLLSGIPGYTAYSNRESGEGRPDIILYPDETEQAVILFELKTRKKLNEMTKGLEEALNQIKEKKYAEGILEEGYVRVKAYGICFCKKTCIAAVFI